MQGADQSFKKLQVQKIHLVDCIHIPKFGLCRPHNNSKIDIQYSSFQSKLLNSPQLWMDFLKSLFQLSLYLKENQVIVKKTSYIFINYPLLYCRNRWKFSAWSTAY